ncbi:hypothetical protein Taro_009168 [Colocasia esculenta]|uniref:Uncharacterized protein n=1 Tax=Colocasia esculenta TaxID=4460 RepID=A0A843TZE7_COLES|nr:hypothetical protein [Colocasia esculenta]
MDFDIWLTLTRRLARAAAAHGREEGSGGRGYTRRGRRQRRQRSAEAVALDGGEGSGRGNGGLQWWRRRQGVKQRRLAEVSSPPPFSFSFFFPISPGETG